MRLSARLMGTAAAAVLAGLLLLAWSARTIIENRLTAQLTDDLIREARLIQSQVGADDRAWSRLAGRAAGVPGYRITLLDPDGAPRADSRLPPARLRDAGSYATMEEVEAALAGNVGSATRIEDGERWRFVALPARPDLPVVRVAASLEPVSRATGDGLRSLFWPSLLALLAGLAIAWFGTRAVARPLTELSRVGPGLADGQTARLAVARSGIREIDALGDVLRAVDRVRLEDRERRDHRDAQANAIIETMLEGVIVSDARGRVITANPAARRLLGFSGGEPVPDLTHLFRSRPGRELVTDALAGQVVEGRELPLGDLTLLATSRPRPEPPGGVVLVFHDLSELRRLEAVRRDFVANASHELKTPLTSIAGWAETLRDEHPPDSTTGRVAETILANARRMQTLIDDQLDLARIEGGHWEPIPAAIDLHHAIREAWAPFAGQAGGTGVRFEVTTGEDAGTLHADATALRQILENLFDNALRHTPAGGTIAATSGREDHGLRLTIRDTGSGIPGEHLSRIFERYYRVDPARSRAEGGTGLGLSIVRHLVEGHGGYVRADSLLGQGTSISCWFPDPPEFPG